MNGSTQIRIDLDLHKPLKIAAAEAGKSIQEYVSAMLRADLKAKGVQLPLKGAY